MTVGVPAAAALWQLAAPLDVCFLTVDPHVCDVDANTKALFKLLKSIGCCGTRTRPVTTLRRTISPGVIAGVV